MAEESGPIAARYGAAAGREWELALHHLDMAPGFVLLILAVPDGDGAALCRSDLERHLTTAGRRLAAIAPATPAAMHGLAAQVLATAQADGTTALWVEAVTPPFAPDAAAWEAGWRTALGGLNQGRNPLRQSLAGPLLLVMAPWAIPLARDMAPDLWSVRTAVIHIEPQPQPGEDRPALRRDDRRPDPSAAPDPKLALRKAERLRGMPGREEDMALLLHQAGLGLHGRAKYADAEPCFREAAELLTGLERTVEAGIAVSNWGHAVRNQGRPAEAEALLRQALALQEEGGATATSRSNTLDYLGRTIRDQGRAAEAEAHFRRALALADEGGDTAINRSMIFDGLARAIRDQGRAAEAEALFRQAMAVQEEGGDTATSRSITLHELARTVRDQGRAAEAEALFRQAMALKEEGGDTATSRGRTLHDLAHAIYDQGRVSEAEALLRQALTLQEDGGDTATSRSVTFDSLARTVHNQGRAAEAEALLRQALTLGEEGGDTPESLAITLANLALVVRDQGRAAEAVELLARARALRGQAEQPLARAAGEGAERQRGG